MIDEKLAEKLSSLLDGELGHTETLKLWKQMESDPELRAQWNRYNRQSSLLAQRPGILPDNAFAERVKFAIADEPTVLAPRVVRKRLIEKLTSSALAAGLALAAVLVGQSLVGHSNISGSNLMAEARYAAPSATGANRVAMDPDFQNYLVLHNETAYLAGAEGLLPYARVVSAQPTR